MYTISQAIATILPVVYLISHVRVILEGNERIVVEDQRLAIGEIHVKPRLGNVAGVPILPILLDQLQLQIFELKDILIVKIAQQHWHD